MTFKLRIKGRDYFESSSAANSANPLILTELEADLPTMAATDATVQYLTQHTISRLAGLADLAIEKAKPKTCMTKVTACHPLVGKFRAINVGLVFQPPLGHCYTFDQSTNSAAGKESRCRNLLTDRPSNRHCGCKPMLFANSPKSLACSNCLRAAISGPSLHGSSSKFFTATNKAAGNKPP